jgi:hypothetical protein
MPVKKMSNRGKVKVKFNSHHKLGDGRLISTNAQVIYPDKPRLNSPDAPDCIKCIPKFMLLLYIAFFRFCFEYLTSYMYQMIFSILLSAYHSRRVAYSESMRYVPDEVHGVYRIRRAGLIPGTNELYPYKPEVYGTIQEAQKACDKIFDKVLERYRTGQPSPKNIWQAIHANIKLRCPVCRKYNVDPLLFDGGKDG